MEGVLWGSLGVQDGDILQGALEPCSKDLELSLDEVKWHELPCFSLVWAMSVVGPFTKWRPPVRNT